MKKWIVDHPFMAAVLAVTAVSIAVAAVLWFQAAHYSKEREAYRQTEAAQKAQHDLLVGENKQLREQIADLEMQKQAFKTLGEQGVKLDQEKAKEIDEISAKQATDLEAARGDMDCRARAERTVALLRTAKPPINLNLADVIRKQCPSP